VYRPVRQIIQEIFSCPSLAKEMTYHNSTRVDDLKWNEQEIVDVYDGKAYKDIMKDPTFNTDPRNVIIGITTDGVQPYTDDDQYSIWPIVLTFYNLPPYLRYQVGCAPLVGIIVGKHKKETKQDIIPYFKLLCDELDFLQEHGIQIKDSSNNNETFVCKARILHIISDLRGLEKVLDQPPVPSTYACMKCWVRGDKYKSGKTHYPGAATFVAPTHQLRNSLLKIPISKNLKFNDSVTSFPEKKQEQLKERLTRAPEEVISVEKAMTTEINKKPAAAKSAGLNREQATTSKAQPSKANKSRKTAVTSSPRNDPAAQNVASTSQDLPKASKPSPTATKIKKGIAAKRSN
jgi:hypothetical protein